MKQAQLEQIVRSRLPHEPGRKGEKQLSRIAYAMLQGPLTQLEALRRFGCMRLGARIWELRTVYCLPIKTEIITRRKKSYALYSYEVEA